MKKSAKGQIGPMSLEDIYPMVLAVIILFVYVSFVFSTVAGNLEQKSIESRQKTGQQLLDILSRRSVFVYEEKEGLFDSDILDEYTYRPYELEETYGFPGYGISIEVADSVDPSRRWIYETEEATIDYAALSSPVAVRYRSGSVHEGILTIRIWRK